MQHKSILSHIFIFTYVPFYKQTLKTVANYSAKKFNAKTFLPYNITWPKKRISKAAFLNSFPKSILEALYWKA